MRHVSDTNSEVARFQAARKQYKTKLEALRLEALAQAGEEAAAIFEAHGTILADDFFFQNAIDRTVAEKVNIAFAICMEKDIVAKQFAELDDPYLRERATDIEAVCNGIIALLEGYSEEISLQGCSANDVILIAEDLTRLKPSAWTRPTCSA